MHEHILDVLSSTATPLTAKTLTEAIRRTDRRIQQPVVFRALKRLLDEGRILRVELLRAYAVLPLVPMLLFICASCGAVHAVPAPSLHRSIARRATERGFRVSRIVSEVQVTCGACRPAPPPQSRKAGDDR